MTYQSEKDEDEVFNSLSSGERSRYSKEFEKTRDVKGSLNSVLGNNWYDKDGYPKGGKTANRPK